MHILVVNLDNPTQVMGSQSYLSKHANFRGYYYDPLRFESTSWLCNYTVHRSSDGPTPTIFWFSESLERAHSDGMLKSQMFNRL